MSEVTEILSSIESGNAAATDRLLAIVYDELRRIAASKLARESPGNTLQATALVHEAWMRLTRGKSDLQTDPTGEPSAVSAGSSPNQPPNWETRGHFFAAAAEAMRRILIDSARRKKQLKRGGGRIQVDIDGVELGVNEPSVDLLALDQALLKLELEDKTKADIVKLRYFTGLTIEDTAEALGIGTATVKRYWNYARVWLRREMQV